MEMMRRFARRVLGRPNPSPERLALKSLLKLARQVPPKTAGTVEIGKYQIQYVDINTLALQWHELFVDRRLQFNTSTASPRILDCGGNMGLATLYFKSCYPSAKITVFEADPNIYNVCRHNIINNGYRDAELINAAVWIENGEISFCSEGTDAGTLSQLKHAGLRGTERSIRSIRLKELLAKEKIDFLKLDIEGAEFDVLADCADVLSNVSRIVIELHETDPTNRRSSLALDILSKAGFRFTMESLSPMIWSSEPMGTDEPFPGKRAKWVVMVYGWQP